jgi:hypothetical protein
MGKMTMHRQAEVEQLVPSFRAAIFTDVTKWRGVDGVDVVKLFAEAIERQRDRYRQKLLTLRDDPMVNAGMLNEVERQVNQMADEQISRAKARGKIEFTEQI